MSDNAGVVHPGNGLKVKVLTLADLDRRSAAYRKTAELIDAVEADCGGPDQLSTAERQIVRHAALVSAMVEDLAVKWFSGEPIDPSTFSALTSAARRLYETIGIKRRAHDVTPPSVADYLEHKAKLKESVA